jgi:hypothetical protein
MVAAGARLFRLDAGVYFFAVNSNIYRRVNADPDLSATHAKHGDLSLGSNGDGFADATGQYQHAIPLNWFRKYQGTNTPEMGLALLIVIHRTHRPGDSPSVEPFATDLRSFAADCIPNGPGQSAWEMLFVGPAIRASCPRSQLLP